MVVASVPVFLHQRKGMGGTSRLFKLDKDDYDYSWFKYRVPIPILLLGGRKDGPEVA